MKKIQLAVFDMAGTTVNEDNVVYKTVRDAFAKHGVEVSLETVLRFGAGKEKFKAIADILEETKTTEIDANSVFKDFKDMLEEAYNNLEVTSYDGVEELFKLLKNKDVKVVLNTGYDQKTAQSLLNKLGWVPGQQIDGLITADDVVHGRPSSEMIDKAMAMFGITASANVIKAGDSVIDIEEGKNANCGWTVGVLTGAQTREQLATAEPSMILDSLADLADVLFP
ncbi:HAD-superfamily hydrolase, subfamily IA, variant 1 [Allomuricauda ruestringensis DSM 13258]|uniref:HAD-superfamily hydrolase, subfamily IA, variant 1 n=1 Tax=Allomuricauda ruestringensis (strain DSM 13258 / CIP 107369 / LMG 19739 / B1) TaxID=886377 RepID=G2PS47_ALLRU|nr:phosphonatase-like hydrolase [Allomuricauda ruestringensis]AEM69637.1 HAD-superfamily hydrolase, subfamily IA, variant 1 [Allomuricauda ruestringensis DSM 13258]